MKSGIFAFGLLMASSAAVAETTDFGVRTVPGSEAAGPVKLATAMPVAQTASGMSATSLATAVAVASRLGRVTSTRRSVAHNRRVGGVRNSFHISGRAIDVVPRAGVRHADVEAALRNAGFHLIESLNEGDHSHFAFGSRPTYAPLRQAAQQKSGEVTDWGMVSAPRMASR